MRIEETGELELVRLLSRGTWSEVYEIRRGQARLAMKVLSRGASRVHAARFALEADALTAVRHDNVVRALRVVSDARGPRAIFMPLLLGRSLREWLCTLGPMASDFAVRVFADLLLGLDAIHARGLVHRDVKPSNVFVGREASEPVTRSRGIVIDLGFAKGDDTSITTGRHLVGAPRYLAPEQLLSGRVDQRADVWAAGLTFIEALTGFSGFDSDDPRSILETDPVDAVLAKAQGQMRRDVLSFAPVLRQSLAKRPNERFVSARALRSALIEAHERGLAA